MLKHSEVLFIVAGTGSDSFPAWSRDVAAALDVDGAIWRCCEVDTHCSGVWGGLLEM